MYSGFVKSSAEEESNHHLFYWLFKNAVLEDPALVVWLNGGPGSSSMLGNFLENGPIRIAKTGDTQEDYELTINPEGSWMDVADVIFVD